MAQPMFSDPLCRAAFWFCCSLTLFACAATKQAPERAPSEQRALQGGVYIKRSTTPASRNSPTVVSPKILVRSASSWPDNVPQGHSGVVRLSIRVGADGVPNRLNLLSSTDERFNAVALSAARKLRFSPGTKDGKPFPMPVPWTFVFKARVAKPAP